MIVDNYTYKNCGKIKSIKIASLIPINDYEKSKNIIYETYENLTMLKLCLLIYNINNIYVQIETINMYNKYIVFYIHGCNIPKFLELE